jgi:glutamyl-Q tRNA(Asp) synthetase
MSLEVVTRFAPSPTGLLHLGHAWSAMLSHDVARQAGGRFLLRIEDIDEARCRPAFVDAILQDLAWLGLHHDGPVCFQSARTEAYVAALNDLIERGLAYRCWCTRAEISASSSAPQGEAAPLYSGTCKGRAEPSDGRSYCWRLDAQAAAVQVGPVAWTEEGQGDVLVDPKRNGDVVLARKDALSAYHLAVTVDDAWQGITHVVRGADLFDATHVHRLLQASLGFTSPQYQHHGLIVGADGKRLAKRKLSPTIASLRESGVDPLRLIDGMRAGRFPIGFALQEA